MMSDESAVLVVDDEEMITWAISQGLSRNEELRVATAQSGEEALELLKARPFDLVITDIRMEGLNGFELLSHVRTLYPETGVVVMTAYGSDEAKREASERGSLFYLDKTFEMDEMRQVVRDALEQVQKTRALAEQQPEGFSGQISDLNLVDMVQLHCLARNSAMMQVRGSEHNGVIGFLEGEIVYAVTEAGLVGRDAFIDMLGWTGGQFETTDETPKEENINESWEALLIEATDVISAAARASEAAAAATVHQARTEQDTGPVDMHGILEGLSVEQGVMAVYLAGDTGELIDQVTTGFHGDPADIGRLASGLTAVSAVRHVLEPDAAVNRMILQFDRNRVLTQEIASTAVYLIVISSRAGSLPHLLSRLDQVAERLATLF